MKSSVLLFAIPFALFIAWMAYLGWLVAGRPMQAPSYPLVVSQPQILVSDLVIIGEVGGRDEDDPATVTVVEVLNDKTSRGPKVGDKIQVDGLASCHPVKRGKNDDPDPPHDWDGPGQYLVPLRRKLPGAAHYEVVAVPPSPGFHQSNLQRVYPATAEVLAQYERMNKPKEEKQEP